MARFLAGAAASFLLLTGVFLFWQSRAESNPTLPSAPSARTAGTSLFAASVQAPEASAKSREERRFSRADKNKDGKIESNEIFAARHKAFAKLDANGNGWLSAAEYATTAPPAPKHKTCSCGSAAPAQSASSDD